ncbi:MAG: DUF4124 domain-containing protein [Burkholderiales bacterium]
MPIRILALVFLALNAPAAFGQIYKCVDEHGVTQYADKPCRGLSGGAVDIHAAPPMSGEAAPHAEDLHQAERDFLRRQAQRREAEEAESKAAAADKARCESLRTRAQIYRQVGRISTLDANGQRHYMDDSTRAARLAELSADIARSCN